VRRAGWNAITFNYRGSWGSAGVYRFAQNLEDVDAVLAYLRDPANAARLAIDTQRIVLAGHSMGGWVVAHTASHDHGLIGAILISAGDMGRLGEESRDRLVADMADNMEGLSGVTAQSMADEDRANAKAFRMENAAAGLSQIPLLVLTSDDGLASRQRCARTRHRSQGRTQDHRNPRRYRPRLVRSPYRAGERNSHLVSWVALASA
jgi:pimeloyl-ACP methyl ester carboxylesterase